MNITVYGSGYVGLVAAACFAEVGHHVLCMDINENKIKQLQSGYIPIYEPGLEAVVKLACESSHLQFTTDARMAVRHGECQFIAVGTPPDAQGHADLSYVLAVARAIGQHMQFYTVVVDKSTVPIGTADEVRVAILEELARRQQNIPFDVVSNPEFLKEGAALEDFRKPDRVILGGESEKALQLLKQLYASFNSDNDCIITMDTRSAELTKYAANAMLATKISFMNEMAILAEKVGADIEKVRIGIGSDQRIGYHFMHAGCGYGGSCFGKDIQALIHTAQEYQSSSDIIEAVEKVNDRQKLHLFRKIEAHFHYDLKGKVFAVWGLSFKPETDDIRDAPSQVILRALWEKGATVQAYDPQAMSEAEKVFGKRQDLQYGVCPEEVLEGADALIILTEWRVFRSPDFDKIKKMLRTPIIFDGRNIYDPLLLAQAGFTYYGIGRGERVRFD